MNRACPPCTYACRQGRNCAFKSEPERTEWHPAELVLLWVGMPALLLFITGLAAGWIA